MRYPVLLCAFAIACDHLTISPELPTLIRCGCPVDELEFRNLPEFQTDSVLHEESDDYLGDDFLDEVKQRDQAGAETGSELAQEARVRQIQRSDLNEQAKFVRINPQTLDCGIIGRRAEVRGSPDSTAAGPIVQLAHWPGDDVEVCPVTISADADINLSQLSALLTPILQVRWGTGGAQYVAEVDIGSGVQFTLNASSVYVGAFMDVGSDPAFPAFISASVGFYAASQSIPAFRSRRLVLDAAATDTAVRPKFATIVYGLERSLDSQQITLVFRSAAGVILYRRVLAASTYLAAPIPLTSAVADIRVTNDGGAVMGVTVIFGLSF